MLGSELKREGNIYYLYNAMIPNRDESFDWRGYLPGNTSKTLWNDYLEFNSLANVDDGSCLTLIVEGCTDSSAFNYDSTANVMMAHV